jgi:NAD(P)-dependent dehydrogenase (short-subunit alcohol dehydrogenase family)
MASISGTAGSPLFGHYAAAKAGVINLSKTAAIEFRGHGVRVNAVCPAFIDTEMVRAAKPGFDAAIGGDFTDVIISRQGRLGEVGDVTPLVVFHASDRSRFSTASAFVVDGGWTGSLL